MTTSRRYTIAHRRAGSTLLAVCYAFGLLVTIGHLACAHAECITSCHDGQDHAHGHATSPHAVITSDHHAACEDDHVDDHVGVAIADQKSMSAGASHDSVTERSFALPDQRSRYRQPLDCVLGVQRGIVAAAPSRAPPASRVS